jgi:hypothetical protein
MKTLTIHIKKLLLMLAILNAGHIFSQPESSIQGRRLPSLTTAQRDQIRVIDSPSAKGMLIYNIDINCLEYWDGDEWISLCNNSSNPEVGIPEVSCGKIRVYGKYYENAPLNDEHYIMLPVTVTKKGNYTITAASSNGYFFQTSGIFGDIGTFKLKLDGMGTPKDSQIDHLKLTCNGATIGDLCDITVQVDTIAMGYIIDCDDIKVMGSYQAKQVMDGDNYVMVPIDVVQTGMTTIQTDIQNGLKFSATKMLNDYGYDTLILRAEGSPIQEGAFKYTLTADGSIENTCSFIVNCFSTLGTPNNPACNCLAIYEERPFLPNGEYWVKDCEGGMTSATRTYCDIAGGGWTLVWSYSEKTAHDVYVQVATAGTTGNANRMEVGAYWLVSNDRPTNRITTASANDGPTDLRIDYNNFRLNKNEWASLSSGPNPQIKVRITDNPTDMNDEWALNNYGIISPRNNADNPMNMTASQANVPTTGKIYGKHWEVRPTGGSYGGWEEVTNGERIILLYNGAYATHWDWANAGSGTLFEVYPNRGGDNNEMRMNGINNGFGWFGETESNHHFGKCNNGAGANDDYSFVTKTCASANLVPHSFNGGQGRYLQWFIK